jgi:predicted alpha/beta superfamily hydrolase
MKLLHLFVLAACSGRSTTLQPASVTQAAIGETLTIDSKILGERRTINVYVPPDYAKGERYPVLYMPDGGMKEDFPHVVGSVDVSIKNTIIRPVIVVGVENTERRRDLPGPTAIPEEQNAAPNAGGNERFRAFLRDELKPMITARYRTTNESAIIGESLAGLFVVETFLVEPALFDGYIAADPSLWWNDESLIRSAGPRLAWLAGPKSLYVATSEMQDGVAMLLQLLGSYAPPGVTWKHEAMPDEHHGSLYPTAALHGIRMVFAAESQGQRASQSGSSPSSRRITIPAPSTNAFMLPYASPPSRVTRSEMPRRIKTRVLLRLAV